MAKSGSGRGSFFDKQHCAIPAYRYTKNGIFFYSFVLGNKDVIFLGGKK